MASEALQYPGTTECGDPSVSPYDLSSNYASYVWAFADNKRVDMVLTSSNTVYTTYDWCVTDTTLTMSSLNQTYQTWTLVANDSAYVINSRVEGCYDGSMTLNDNTEADCTGSTNMWYSALCTSVKYGATETTP